MDTNAEVERMAHPDVQLEGTLGRNTPGPGHATEYRFDDAIVEVDLSEVPDIDESLEGAPVTAQGHFEFRKNPENSAPDGSSRRTPPGRAPSPTPAPAPQTFPRRASRSRA